MNRIINFRKFIKESKFGNGIYVGKSIIIPDDLAIWCMDFYAEQTLELYDYTKIPKNIIIESKKLISSYDTSIYRGFGIENEITDEEYLTFDPKGGISWTLDEDIARSFSEKYENMGLIPYVAEINNFKRLKYVISMDLIMDNITSEQVKMLSNYKTKRDIEQYYSESEVLIFDKIKLNIDNIQPLW